MCQGLGGRSTYNLLHETHPQQPREVGVTLHGTGQNTEVQRGGWGVQPRFAGEKSLAAPIGRLGLQRSSNSPEAIRLHHSVPAMTSVRARSPGMLNLLSLRGQSQGLENCPLDVATAAPHPSTH